MPDINKIILYTKKPDPCPLIPILQSPLTLVKLAKALDIEVFELFMPLIPSIPAQNERKFEKMRRFAHDLTLVLDASTAEASNSIKKNVARVCKEYLG